MDNETIELIKKYNKVQPSYGPEPPLPKIFTEEEIFELANAMKRFIEGN